MNQYTDSASLSQVSNSSDYYYVMSSNLERRTDITVYALICPITQKPFYVGKTNDPEGRLRNHAKNNPHYKELLTHGIEYQFCLKVLARYSAKEYASYLETEWILEHLDQGYQLINGMFPSRLSPAMLQRYFDICENNGWQPQQDLYHRWTMPDYGGAK